MITLSEDATTCPACSAPLVPTSRSQRQCNACGLDAVVIGAEDQLDADAAAQVTTRAYSEDRGSAHEIERFQRTW